MFSHQSISTQQTTQAEESTSSTTPLKLAEPSQFSWALKSVYAERDFALPACIGFRRD